MSGKVVAFIIFLLGAGIFFLGLLKSNFNCDKQQDTCVLQSSVLGVKLDSMHFKLSELEDITCERKTQAARGGGKRAYYELTLQVKEKQYVLESCPNLKICRRHVNTLKDFKKSNTENLLNYNSSMGVANVMGLIMGVALLILGGKMFFYKDIPQPEEE